MIPVFWYKSHPSMDDVLINDSGHDHSTVVLKIEKHA